MSEQEGRGGDQNGEGQIEVGDERISNFTFSLSYNSKTKPVTSGHTIKRKREGYRESPSDC